VTSDLDFTPYSTASPFFDMLEDPLWVPEMEKDRIQSYDVYDKLFWGFPRALRLQMEGDSEPIYIPAPRTIVESTAHFLLKGLQIGPGSTGQSGAGADALKAFLKRERFLSRFNMNKQAGVRRGDWVFHMTVDTDAAKGRRISLTPIDPASYFPIYDPEDIDKLLGIMIADQWESPDKDGKVYIHRVWYEYVPTAAGRRVVVRDEIVEAEGWFQGKKAKVRKVFQTEEMLPSPIDTIPVFHLPNIEEPANPFGSSELRGFERLVQAINQSISDEEVALALEGLGLYATNAPPPTNADGVEEDWVVAPARVLELQGGKDIWFKRVEGIGSVRPTQDHLKFLLDNLYEGSSTFRPGAIDVQVAESGVALALKFLPTLAKIEDRDLTGKEKLEQMFWNWNIWHNVFEESHGELEIVATLGSKLPESRKEKLNELNNMFDRKVISAEYYRQEMAKLGYVFPDGMMEQIIKEQTKWMELNAKYRQAVTGVQEDGQEGDEDESTVPGAGNASNNAKRPNESGGTEAD
jgi:hypothetical protein